VLSQSSGNNAVRVLPDRYDRDICSSEKSVTITKRCFRFSRGCYWRFISWDVTLCRQLDPEMEALRSS